jgi:uncharacterized protein
MSTLSERSAECESKGARYPLRVWKGRWAVCRLEPSAAVPEWTGGASPLTVVARTQAEMSIVAPESIVPRDVVAERGFRVIEVVGPVPFEVTGLIAALTAPLADNRISVFPLATYDTDYLLVQEARLDDAVAALRDATFSVELEP